MRCLAYLFALVYLASSCPAEEHVGNTTPLNALQQVNLTPSEVQEWKERAETGDLEAAFRLAYHMLNQDDEETQKEGRRWAALAADMGNADAALLLGYCYYRGIVVEHDAEKAFKYLNMSANAGKTEAFSIVAMMYQTGTGIGQNIPKALEMHRKAVIQDTDDADVYDNFALFLIQHPEAAEPHELETLLLKSAGLGNTEAMVTLASCYFNGIGVEQDYTRAAELVQAAANEGHPYAICALGQMHLHGWGIEQDIDKAEAYCRQVITQHPDFAVSYAILADCLLCKAGASVPTTETYREACRLLRQGTELNDAEAWRGLGKAYEEGWAFEQDTQLPPDAAKAQECYGKAAALEESAGKE